MRLLIGFFLLFFLGACNSNEKVPKRPNILIAISDDQSFPHAGAYGYESAKTPNFDRVAADGVLFNNAFSAAPGCSPSRASLLTGRYIWQLEEAGTHASSFQTQYICYTDLLEKAGYHVGYTAKGWGPGNWKISGRAQNPAGTSYSDIKDENVPEYINKTDYAANFEAFLEKRTENEPFCFWYGATEPHRLYKSGIGSANGFDSMQIVVPSFLPDAGAVKSDMADYLYEIQHFDTHLGRMLQKLEEIGELENTLIVVTSDNGMPFPRAKANLYEYGFHMPLAVMWADQIKGGRVVDDLISLTDLAPTFLEAAQVDHPSDTGDAPAMSGKSFLGILKSNASGIIEPERDAIYAGRERHSSSRWNNLTYPIRAIRTNGFLFIRNFEPDRWPAGDPQKFEADSSLSPGYHDIDNFTENYVYIHREDEMVKPYFELAVAKRPAEELFDVKNDPGCLVNLATNPEYEDVLVEHREKLMDRLQQTGDPRVTGNGDVWESYIRYSPIRTFPKPE